MNGMTFATVDGITLHTRQEGTSGAVPLVFINPLGCDLRIWDGVVAHLGQQAHIIRYDKRGSHPLGRKSCGNGECNHTVYEGTG